MCSGMLIPQQGLTETGIHALLTKLSKDDPQWKKMIQHIYQNSLKQMSYLLQFFVIQNRKQTKISS